MVAPFCLASLKNCVSSGLYIISQTSDWLFKFLRLIGLSAIFGCMPIIVVWIITSYSAICSPASTKDKALEDVLNGHAAMSSTALSVVRLAMSTANGFIFAIVK